METLIKLLLSLWTVFHSTCGYNIKHIKRDESWADRADYYKELEHSIKYQPGYGTEWILFPDGNGIPHFVNLTMTKSKHLRSGKNIKIEYTIYHRKLCDYISLDQSAQPSVVNDLKRLLSNKPIKIVTHGWLSSAADGMVKDIKDAYLKRKDVAVITVDWSDTANEFLYPLVVENTGRVGARIGQFLDAFCALYNISGDRLHLIGHSLGAHVMGVAASTTNASVGRVTGLDPAGPLYEYKSKKSNPLSLDSSKAEFVDVIHSCSGVLGVKTDSGHADFYPNKGVSPQPGCEKISRVFVSESCSHQRAHMYYTESIHNPTGFPACRAENWGKYLNRSDCKQQTYLGENIDRNATGRYYLETNAQEPFARNVS